jgi:ribonucleoside-diphosphate reductase alpha chain
LVDKFAHMRFEPSGFTKNPQIPYAKSIVDYLFRWLASKFLDEQARQEVGVISPVGSSATAASFPLATGVAPAESSAARKLEGVRPRAMTVTADIGDGKDSSLRQAFINQADAPPCPDCGCIMVRNGTCYKCMNCGATSGCS